MATKQNSTVPQWGRFEQQFVGSESYTNPVQEVRLIVSFTSPSGRERYIEGFWDGESVWRVRFSPDETGIWTFTTHSDPEDSGLCDQQGQFTCGQPSGTTRFEQHGPVQLSSNRRYLVHADGTPFLWLGDTAWNGPLRATPGEWEHYLRERVRQKFTAVQWVTTQWLAAPDGDLRGEKAFTGTDRIAVNPVFFQRLDGYVEATARAGLLNVPVLLWAAQWSTPEVNQHNPGLYLPEDQAALLARYMVARWSACPVIWILPGDGHYQGEKAERWKRIGRAVFGDAPHAPVSLHPAGMQWNGEEFRSESWLDILGYQSGHGDDESTLEWLVCGPPSRDWQNEPSRPLINLEPPYENHISYQSRKRIGAGFTRRALYWSLLVSPTAGVSYGGHGIWGWDDGTAPPVGHPTTGVPLPWQQALVMDGAEQIRHLADLLESIEWWRLIPAPDLLAHQPGDHDKGRYVSAAKSPEEDLIVVYIPQDRDIELNLTHLPDDLSAVWFDPRTGARQPATVGGSHFTTPAAGDWVLLLGRGLVLPAGQGKSS